MKLILMSLMVLALPVSTVLITAQAQADEHIVPRGGRVVTSCTPKACVSIAYNKNGAEIFRAN